ncbi:MAG: hypothetical protein M1833_003685 [Piccolia ochrophora]|nr:MAG: hypothetical protein M1833_003685 [Piccolia ochrophora]
MRSKKPRASKAPLGDSWVVEGDDEDGSISPPESSDEPPNTHSPGSKSTSTRASTRPSRSREPELVMPSLDTDTMDGSWVEDDRRPRASPRVMRRRQQGAEGSKRQSAGNSVGNGNTQERRSRTFADTKKRYPARTDHGSSNASAEAFTSAVSYFGVVVSWALEVVGGAFSMIKQPLSLALGVCLILGLGALLLNRVTNSIHAVFAPICQLPGASFLPICSAQDAARPSSTPAPPVEFDQMMSLQSKFEDVLENSAGSVSLPLDMKRGEASMRDLRQLVRYSSLHSKNELVLEFDGFIDTARIASYDLQRYNSHIGRAVDNVLATTRWTMRVLDGIALEDGSKGAVQSFISDKLLAPFRPVRDMEAAVLDQYIQHTRVVQEEINRLISEAQALLLVLNNLEDRLDVMHGIVTRDDNHAKATKDEILSQLWTMIGGNRGKLNKMNRQLHLLEQVSVYRKTAYAHVSGTILRLQEIGAGLEDLRERVGAPELLRDRSDIPLSVHIENIQAGVERLENGRSHAKRLENDQLRKRLNGGNAEEHLIDGPKN